MSGITIRTGRVMGMLAAIACGAGVASAQVQGGDGGGGGGEVDDWQLPPPVFDPALVFTVDVGNPYGLAAADILNASGAAGQDGYPEIAVAGTGVNLFDPFMSCEQAPSDHYIKIYHNKGATIAWDGSSVGDPHDALEWKQTLDLGAAAPGMWATEMVFADVTGGGDPDLVLVGLDPDSSVSAFGRLLVFESLGNGSFGTVPLVNMASTVPFRGLVACDFDLDGDIDVIAAASDLSLDWGCVEGEQDVVVVFRNTTSENFGTFGISQSNPLSLGNGSAPGDIATADFFSFASGVPLMDLAMPHPGSSTTTAAANLGTMSFDPDTLSPPSGCVWRYVTMAAEQFGVDPDWDFAAVDPNDLFVDAFSGDGNGAFVSTCADPYQLYPPNPEFFLHAHGIEAGKIDHSPNPDLAVTLGIPVTVAGENTPEWYGAVAVLLGVGDGTFQTPSATQAYIFLADDPLNPNQPLAYGSANLLVVDLDADGFDDIVVANHLVGSGPTDTISVLVNSLAVTPSGP